MRRSGGREATSSGAMAESLPVVTLPGEEEGGGAGSDIAVEDIAVLHEVVVEELPVVEGDAGEGVPVGFQVTEPAEDVIELEEEEKEEERISSGPPRGGMSTDAGIHPVTVPTALPVEGEGGGDGGNGEGDGSGRGGDDCGGDRGSDGGGGWDDCDGECEGR